MSSPDMDVDVGGTPEPESIGVDDMARDGESDLVVQQLERGLPRWEGPGDAGWMKEKEGSEDRWLEFVLAIKGHKDTVCVLPLLPLRTHRLSAPLAVTATRQRLRPCQKKPTSPICLSTYVLASTTGPPGAAFMSDGSQLVPPFVKTCRGSPLSTS